MLPLGELLLLGLRDDADEERRVDALVLLPALFALVPDRGLLFDVLLLLEALDFVLPELRADPLAFEPLAFEPLAFEPLEL